MCDKTSVKVANLVLQALHAHREGYDPQAGPRRSATTSLEEVLALCRKIDKCANRLPLARASLERELADAASHCRVNLECLAMRRRRRRFPSMRELVGELEALRAEFGGWSFEPKEESLSVATEPVELEGVPLGPFRIRLDLKRLPFMETRPVYKVIALEPNPPAWNKSITHPHVRNDLLCEGGANSAIETALIEGRLHDFFLLVAAVLRNYNRASPFARLESWDGVPCADCGNVTAEEDRYTCQSCEQEFCDGCSSACKECDTVACLSCLSRCQGCGGSVCGDCLKACRACGEAYCESCLEKGVCDSCREDSHEMEKTEAEEPAA